MKYRIVLQESEEGFAVSCPGLPGCWSQGETEEEAVANITEAIKDYLATNPRLFDLLSVGLADGLACARGEEPMRVTNWEGAKRCERH